MMQAASTDLPALGCARHADTCVSPREEAVRTADGKQAEKQLGGALLQNKIL
jgi:hypothetical protein